MASPQEAFDQAVALANGVHQVETAKAIRAFAMVHAGMPEYEDARAEHGRAMEAADAARNQALATASAELVVGGRGDRQSPATDENMEQRDGLPG